MLALWPCLVCELFKHEGSATNRTTESRVGILRFFAAHPRDSTARPRLTAPVTKHVPLSDACRMLAVLHSHPEECVWLPLLTVVRCCY